MSEARKTNKPGLEYDETCMEHVKSNRWKNVISLAESCQKMKCAIVASFI